MRNQFKIIKRILLLAVALEALKDVVLYLAVNYLSESHTETIDALYTITLFVLILPEMLVSYEKGPHGIPARIVMFTAGTIANIVLVTTVYGVWRAIKARKLEVIADS